MSVQSKSIANGQPITQKAIGIPMAALIIGAVLWPVGARYSIDGLLWMANQLLQFLRVTTTAEDGTIIYYQIATPPVWQAYAVLAVLPIICSRVEWSLSFRKTPAAHAGVVWLLIVGYDVLTTYFGVRYPEPGSWAITGQIAQSIALSGILTTALTFGPEWLMREGWRALRR